MNKASSRSLILAAEFVVIITVFSQFTTSLGIAPLAGQTLTIDLTAAALGKRTGTCAILIYFLLGSIGLPVYTGMSSRFGVFFGLTGSYSIGFIFNGLLAGYILEETTFSYTQAIIVNIADALIILVSGMIWLKHSINLSQPNAFTGGSAPFIIPDIIKAIAVTYVGILIRQRFIKRFLMHLS